MVESFNDGQVGSIDIKSQYGLAGRNEDTIYSYSFGGLKSKTHYAGGLDEVDMRPTLKSIAAAGMKALNTSSGGAGTAGTTALVPVYVDPRIVDRSRKETPLCELLPRVTNMGLTADYNIITAKGEAFTANPDAPMNENDDTEDRESKNIKFIYSVGRVLGPMQAAMPNYMLAGFQPQGAGLSPNTYSPVAAPNAIQYEVLKKARALKEKEEDLIINGDSSSDSTEFDGIVALQSTTNQVDISGDVLEWDDVESAIEEAFNDGGRPKLAVASPAALRQLRNIMIDTLRIAPSDLTSGNTLPFGISPYVVLQTMVGPVPVIPSRFLSNTAGARQIWFLDTDVIELRVLQDMTYEKLAKTNDSEKFMLKIYECLINRAPQFCSFIDNIA